MKLDRHQKEEFMNYWGRCPLVDKTDGAFCTVESVELRPNNNYLISGNKYWLERKPDNTLVYRKDGLANIYADVWNWGNFDSFEPYFVDAGFYQLFNDKSYWFTRKPDRSMMKGLSRNNTSFLSINPLVEGQKELFLYPQDWHITDIARIFYGATHRVSNIDEKIADIAVKNLLKKESDDPFASPTSKGYSLTLSKNVALLSHLSYELPVILYKLKTVGFYADNTAFIHKDKEITRETIEEETGIKTELYDD